jgi:hypothetical protein
VAWWRHIPAADPPEHPLDIRQQITGRDQLAHINWHTSALISDQ